MAGPIAKFSFARDLGTEMVTIYIRASEEEMKKKIFVVHKALLTSQSEYFNKALNGNFKEAEENAIHFDEEDPAAIELLVAFLYLGVIPEVPESSHLPPGLFPSTETETATSFATEAPPKTTGTTYAFRSLDVVEEIVPQRFVSRFEHICFDQSYNNHSPEELRLADYDSYRKYGSAAAIIQLHLPPLPAISMMAAISAVANHSNNTQGTQFGHPASHVPAGGQATSSSAIVDNTDGDDPFASLFSNRPTVIFGNTTPLPRNGSASSWFGTHSWGNPETPPAQTPNTTPTQSPSASPGNSTSGPSGFARYASGQSGLAQTLLDTGSVFNSQLSMKDLQQTRGSAEFGTPSTSLTARNQPLRPGDFGYTRYIRYPEPEGNFLPNIPRSENFGAERASQDALLHLCILAETICWPRLFNAAIDAYIQGERNVGRNIPIQHVDIIYDRTHSNSRLRDYVLDCMRGLEKGANKEYAAMVYAHEDFLDGIMSKLSWSDPDNETDKYGRHPPAKKDYHMVIKETFQSEHRE